MLKTQLKQKEKLATFTLKLKKEELEEMRKLAEKYANGNLSEWIRYTARNFKPKKEDLVK